MARVWSARGGALGIEALSRGAAHATFVDQDRAAVRAIAANLEACGLTAQATVVASPVDRFLAGARDQRWDLALLDPPYEHDHDAWLDLLDRQRVERPGKVGGEPVWEGWVKLRESQGIPGREPLNFLRTQAGAKPKS